jgi:KDO2-lipid IV(A) lauroyltransferase
VALWTELLQMDDIGIHDSFFDLGGHSLLAMRMFAEIQQKFGRAVPMLAFAASPTIAALAMHLTPESRDEAADPEKDGRGTTDNDDFTLRVATSRGARRRTGGRRSRRRPRHEAVPSASRARIFAWCCGQSWIQRRRFADEVQLIRTFYEALARPVLPLADVVRQSLVAHWWARHIETKLESATTEAQIDRMYTVRGLCHLEEAVGRGRGVVLARSHTLGRREALRALVRHGFDEILSIGLGRASRKLRKSADEAYVMAVRSHLLFQSQEALSEGRIVSILPDGFHGNHEGVRFEFHGRQRTFRTGFAELALDTGAAIVVVSASIDLTGRVLVECAPALTVDLTTPRHEQLTNVVTQFVEILRSHWSAHPAAVPWWHMRKHLAL